MMKHYWVTTQDFSYPPYDPEVIFDCVEANNKAQAKGVFVSRNRKALIAEIGSDNPFVGLTVNSAICEHGVCNCDFVENCQLGNPRHPDIDYCKDCYMESAAQQIREALVDFANGSLDAEWRYRCAVEDLMKFVPDSAVAAASG